MNSNVKWSRNKDEKVRISGDTLHAWSIILTCTWVIYWCWIYLVAIVQRHGQSFFSQSNSNFCSSWVSWQDLDMGNKKNKQRARKGTRRLEVEVARR